LFEGYSEDELNEVYLKVNQYNTPFPEIELLASRLYSVCSFKINDSNINNHINNTLIDFYNERSKDEILKCYIYDNKSVMNAYDFIVGYQNYVHTLCNMVEKVDNKGLSLFFKIYKTLYKSFDNTFTTENVNDFITKISKTINILKNTSNKLFPCILTDCFFKNVGNKIGSLKKNNVFLIIMSIIGFLNNETPINIIEKSIEKCILYHFFTKKIKDKETKKNVTLNDIIQYEAGGKYIDNMALTINKNPNLKTNKKTEK